MGCAWKGLLCVGLGFCFLGIGWVLYLSELMVWVLGFVMIWFEVKVLGF